jgi:plasmid stabilization system protein ParE
MDFRVEVAPRARDEMQAIAGYIAGRGSFESADKWFIELSHAIRSLRLMPRSHARARETAEVSEEVRTLFHGPKNRTYKIYYTVDANRGQVRVIHVRHWARKNPTPAELDEMNT